ncbi:FAD-dependent oxidoreductase [Thermoactinomyces mirandus]|uniref:FAD-dependent oxidoreductase n=1 Tax=Thermoactinomyces mirandus TaxID=2756294 RepID=UPI001C68ED3E|nr:FAD-dependent oxidoreductase [Thermoactinomyces mirandus]
MHHSDVVIVGGGLIGSSIAFYLAKSGVKVAVLEVPILPVPLQECREHRRR